MPTQYEIERHTTHVALLVRGSLDINTAPLLAEQIDKLLQEKPAKVVLEMSAVDLIDSSGVAVLVKLYKGVRAQGGQLEMKGVRDQPLAIFKLLRMDKVFGLA